MKQPIDIANYREPLAELIWTLQAAKGEFRLLLVRCNYIRLRSHLLKFTQTNGGLNIKLVSLNSQDLTLHGRIHQQTNKSQPDAIMVLNLESVANLQVMLSTANQVREEFRKHFPFPVVLWVTDRELQALMLVASDLESWGTTITFTVPPQELIASLQHDTDVLFATALLSDKYTIAWQMGHLRRQEIYTATQQLQQVDYPIPPFLQASVDFAIAQTAYLNQQFDTALFHFSRSWEFFADTNHLHHNFPCAGNSNSSNYQLIHHPQLRAGVLHFYLGLCYYQLSEQRKYTDSYLCSARFHLQSCLQIFQTHELEHLIAKYINLLGSIFLHQEAWPELEQLAMRSIDLQRLYGNPLHVAQAYGFLGSVALQNQRLHDAKAYLHKALHSLSQLKFPSPLNARYLLKLAQVEFDLGNIHNAINYTEMARNWGIHDNWRQYLKIFKKLQSYYRSHGQYLEAFRLQQEIHGHLTQQGIYAFVGIKSIHPPQLSKLIAVQWLGINPKCDGKSPAYINRTPQIALEITASGRIDDVNRLIEKISRPDYKLVILHGESGVGKTSLLQAGLIPILNRKSIGFQQAIALRIPIHLNWKHLLLEQLLTVINFQPVKSPNSKDFANELLRDDYKPEFTHRIFQIFQTCIQSHIRLVLIFDDFDDLFFVHTSPKLKQELLEFISNCLDLLTIKIIFSLQSRCVPLLTTDAQIQAFANIYTYLRNQQNYYHLHPLSWEAATQLMKTLTQQQEQKFTPQLIQQILADITGMRNTANIESPIDEQSNQQILPLQLQIIANQLQLERIYTLSQYQKYLSPTSFISRYLYSIISECGSSDREITIQILRLLSCTPQTLRELVTQLTIVKFEQVDLERADLEEIDLEKKCDRILEILVLSEIILIKYLQANPQYQITHTYLYEIIQTILPDQLGNPKSKIV